MVEKHIPSLSEAREIFIEGAQGEFIGEDFDALIEQVRQAERIREEAPRFTVSTSPYGVLDKETGKVAEFTANVSDLVTKLNTKEIPHTIFNWS